jgi:hypothetical protein
VTVGGAVTFNGPACTQPTTFAPETFEETSDAGGQLGKPEGSPAIAPTSSGDNVTSRPFVAPAAIVPAQTVATRPVPQALVAPKASSKTAELRSVEVATGQITTKKPAKGSQDGPTINPPVVMGDTLTWAIGTLPAGGSVTITFQVVVDNPFTGMTPQVSNQGTITADSISPVLTDDPSEVGTNNPTVTPILANPDVSIRDAKVAEPTSGTTNMLFTVVLSTPATASASVNYATANGGATPATGGADCTTPGNDYITSNGTVNFTAGQQVKTIPVTVCSDALADPDETFLVNLSMPTGLNIIDGQAVGTITLNTPGTVLISELRTSGPGGTADEFVEIYNNSDSPHTVDSADNMGYGVFKMGASVDDTPVLVGTIPESTVIPARGHYLFVGSSYSLATYPAGVGVGATGNATLTSDIEDNRNVGIFGTANILNIATSVFFDGVGFGTNTGGNADLLREGTNLAAVAGVTPFDTPATTTQYAFFRKQCDFQAGVGCSTPALPKDTNDNSADFAFADVAASMTPAGQLLGAPGPENLSSPLKRDSVLPLLPLDGTKATSVAPNRVREFTPVTNGNFGTLTIRRRVKNNTGGAVTRLRFRIIEVTTFPPFSGSMADLRALDSTATTVGMIDDPVTCTDTSNPVSGPPCTVDVSGTTVEVPPAQVNGGGLNSSMSVTLGTPVAAGDSINIQLRMGIMQPGAFRILVTVEALP